MGDLTGWLGSRTYDDGWDGGNYWSHIGYPGDLATGTGPSFQGSFSLNGDDTELAANQAMYHQADVCGLEVAADPLAHHRRDADRSRSSRPCRHTRRRWSAGMRGQRFLTPMEYMPVPERS